MDDKQSKLDRIRFLYEQKRTIETEIEALNHELDDIQDRERIEAVKHEKFRTK